MSDSSLLSRFSAKRLPVAIAASLSSLVAAPAIAQQTIAQQTIAQPQQSVDIPIINESTILLDATFNSELPTTLPAQSTSSVFVDQSPQLYSPSIEVSRDRPNASAILIDPILINPTEQSYLNTWEQTATTQLSNISIRSAVQAPITRIQIRAGRPVVERLGRFTTDSFFFNTSPTSTIYSAPAQRRRTALRDLPDGNYRLLLSSSGIGDDGSVDDGFVDDGSVKEGRLFTFRKAGERVTGNFDYIGSGESACVTGTLQGNTVFGEAFTNAAGTRVLDRTYLGPGLSLQLSDDPNDSSAVLSLDGFSLINAGTVAPPVACQ